jgi:hypothetical protein
LQIIWDLYWSKIQRVYITGLWLTKSSRNTYGDKITTDVSDYLWVLLEVQLFADSDMTKSNKI